jgi:hypothetical protein
LYYSYAIIAGLGFLRKILGFIEAFPPEFSDYVQFSLLDSCNTFIELCQNVDKYAVMLEEQNEAMFTEYAETILRFVQLNPINDEGPYYQMLQCPFLAIQKAAYIALVIEITSFQRNPSSSPRTTSNS